MAGRVEDQFSPCHVITFQPRLIESAHPACGIRKEVPALTWVELIDIDVRTSLLCLMEDGGDGAKNFTVESLAAVHIRVRNCGGLLGAEKLVKEPHAGEIS